MDAQVARRGDPKLKELMERFVCVRIVRMRDADLSLFQFDWDLSWAVFFLNADGTIYGRYGSRDGNSREKFDRSSIPGLVAALEGALQLHEGYPANKASLAGKRGPKPANPAVDDYPVIRARFSEDPDEPAKGCVHCHFTWDAVRDEVRGKNAKLPNELFRPYPMPDVVGLEMDLDRRAMVKSVTKGSAAETAGFRAGDEITTAAGQPVLSIADVQWVLHQTKVPCDVAFQVVREGKPEKLSLHLDKDWRTNDVSWRESSSWMRPFFRSDDLDDASRTKLGLAQDALALKVRQMNPQGEPARNGLKVGDIIVKIDDEAKRMDETAFLSYLQQSLVRGTKVRVWVLDGKKRRDVRFRAR